MEYHQADYFRGLSGVDLVSVREDHVPEVLSLCLLISYLFQIGHLNLLLLDDGCGSWHAWGSWHARGRWHRHRRRLHWVRGNDGATFERWEVTWAQDLLSRLLLLLLLLMEWAGLLLSFSSIVVRSLVGVLLLLVVARLVTLP